MPERAVFPLLSAIAIGFIAGIIAASLILEDTATLWLGIAGAATVFVIGVLSVLGSGGPGSERVVVGLLRAAAGSALFACIYLAILALLRDSRIGWALLFAALALLIAVPLGRMHVRERRGERPAPGERPEASRL